jgi:hypothetical protein
MTMCTGRAIRRRFVISIQGISNTECPIMRKGWRILLNPCVRSPGETRKQLRRSRVLTGDARAAARRIGGSGRGYAVSMACT